MHLELDRIVKIPEDFSPTQAARLRSIPVDEEAWEGALTEIDRGLERALSTIPGELHVFATLPYPAAVYLGRRLDDLARTRPVYLYQFDPFVHDWIVFSRPGMELQSSVEPYYQPLEKSPVPPGGLAVLLTIEGMHSPREEPLELLADSIGAAIYRLKAKRQVPLRPDEVPQAVLALRHALQHLQKQHPSASLHIIATAPVTLLIELGRLLTPTVYRSAIVYQFEPGASKNVPVLDVLQRIVLTAWDTP